MKFIELESYDPHFNLAAEEYFYRKNNEDYMWLWRNHNTIVIGKNQNPYNEVNLETVKENGVTIARRMTGGGAVYHDLGNVNFTFITTASNGNGIRQPVLDFYSFNVPVVNALLNLGVKADIQGRNDIVINKKKISGSAQYSSRVQNAVEAQKSAPLRNSTEAQNFEETQNSALPKNSTSQRILHHGTLLFNSDLEFIDKCLSVSSEKLKSKGVSSVRSRVANIIDYISGEISVTEFMDLLKKFLLDGFADCETIVPSEEDYKGIIALRDSKYASWDWVFGSSPVYNYTKSIRFEGCGSVSVFVDIKGGVLNNCRICGDFFGSGNISDIEALLNGCRAYAGDIRAVLNKTEIGCFIHGISTDGFMMLFDELFHNEQL